MKSEIKEKSQIIAKHVFKRYDLRSKEAQDLDKKINILLDMKEFTNPIYFEKRYKELVEKMQKFLVEEKTIENLVATVGRSIFAQRLVGTLTYTGTINYGALGSSSTAPNNADVKLGTEVFRKNVATASYTNNIASIDFYFSKADTNGTYNEWGTFIDGTGAADSGILFSHALTGGWSKLATESMTISTTYSFT